MTYYLIEFKPEFKSTIYLAEYGSRDNCLLALEDKLHDYQISIQGSKEYPLILACPGGSVAKSLIKDGMFVVRYLEDPYKFRVIHRVRLLGYIYNDYRDTVVSELSIVEYDTNTTADDISCYYSFDAHLARSDMLQELKEKITTYDP